MSAAERRGRTVWAVEREHPTYGYEDASLVVNLAGDVLLITGDDQDSTATTLDPADATRLRDALTEVLQEWPA